MMIDRPRRSPVVAFNQGFDNEKASDEKMYFGSDELSAGRTIELQGR
jgi:ABC-type sugar transport system substrate-binding protein